MTKTTQGIFDETFDVGTGKATPKFRSQEHREAWQDQQAAEAKASKMFPTMNAERERDASRSPKNPYPKMAQETAAADKERDTQFEMTMRSDQGREIRQAAREEVNQLVRRARSYPSQRESTIAEIERIEQKFGEWLDVED